MVIFLIFLLSHCTVERSVWQRQRSSAWFELAYETFSDCIVSSEKKEETAAHTQHRPKGQTDSTHGRGLFSPARWIQGKEASASREAWCWRSPFCSGQRIFYGLWGYSWALPGCDYQSTPVTSSWQPRSSIAIFTKPSGRLFFFFYERSHEWSIVE